MNKFFSSIILTLALSSLLAQEQVDFDTEVIRIDSLIEARDYQEADTSLILLQNSLDGTSLIKEDSTLLFFSTKLAFVNYRMGDCEKTIYHSKENIAINTRIYGEGDLLTLASMRNLGVYYLNCDSLQKSISTLQQTLDTHQKYINGADEIYAKTLDDLAFVYGKNQELEKAEELYDKLLAILGDTKSSSFYVHVAENYSAMLMSAERYEKASSFYEDLKEPMKRKADYPSFLRDYYNVFVHLKDYVRALETSSQLAKTCEENDRCAQMEIEEKEFYLNSARLSMLLAKYENAKKYYAQAEKLFKDNSSIYISILLEEAELFDIIGEKYKQLSSLNKSIAFHRQNSLTDSTSFSKSVLQLGRVYTETGRFEQADKLFSNYINDLETSPSPDPLQLAIAYQSLGNQRYLVQNFKDADQYLNKAKSQLVAAGLTETVEYASTLNSLGALYEGLANYFEAERNYREALSLSTSENSVLKISLASNLANVLMKTAPKSDSILTLLNQAIDWQKETSGEDHPTYANMVSNRGLQYQSAESYDLAEKDYKLALRIFSNTVGEEHPQYLTSLANLGLLYNTVKKQDEALETMLKAKGLYEKYYSEIHPGYILTLNNLANLYNDLKSFDEAEELLLSLTKVQVQEINNSFTYLSESEKKSFVKEKQKLLGNFKGYVVGRSVNDEGSVKPEVVEKWYDLELSTKGILLNSTKKVRDQIFNSGDEELITLFSEWTVARKRIADIQSLKNEQSGNQTAQVDSLNRRVNFLEKELSRKSTDFTSSFASKPPTFQDIRNNLLPNEASVEIIRTQIGEEGIYTALIGTADEQFPKIIVIGKGSVLEKKGYQGYKNGIKYKIEDVGSFVNFWEDIQNYLESKNVNRIFYAPDGVYHKISLATIYHPESKKYLLEEITISQVSSTKDILSIARVEESASPDIKDVLLVGRPSYKMDMTAGGSVSRTRSFTMVTDVSDLPGTEEEINEIGKLLDGNNVSYDVLLKNEASESAIKEKLDSELVHIATHGFFLSDHSKDADFDPMLNSGLLFAGVSDKDLKSGEDGILTAFEIMNLELTHTDMVVLSACETGLGEVSSGEGIYGLQRAFFVGGANTVIMSLWKVDDAATKDLMTSFYKEYLKKGNKREAFVNAQKKMRKKYKAPIFWGAFVMLGG
ncbi:MAG: CHAT domain-containing protein [Ekhidna sp.]